MNQVISDKLLLQIYYFYTFYKEIISNSKITLQIREFVHTQMKQQTDAHLVYAN